VDDVRLENGRIVIEDRRAQRQVTLAGDSGEAERRIRDESERHSGMIPNTIGA
jgi:hypothetical protein